MLCGKRKKEKRHLKHPKKGRGETTGIYTMRKKKKCLHATQYQMKKVESLKETFLSFSSPFIGGFLFLLLFFLESQKEC